MGIRPMAHRPLCRVRHCLRAQVFDCRRYVVRCTNVSSRKHSSLRVFLSLRAEGGVAIGLGMIHGSVA